MSTSITEARNKAGSYFKEGYNCAESIFLTFSEYFANEISSDAVKLFTGFGGGVGEAGCMCGALTGSIAILGMLEGRTSNKESRLNAYKVSNEFHNKFRDKFSGTCCHVLSRGKEFGSKEHSTNCLKITGNTAKMLMEFIEEKDLIKSVERSKA